MLLLNKPGCPYEVDQGNEDSQDSGYEEVGNDRKVPQLASLFISAHVPSFVVSIKSTIGTGTAIVGVYLSTRSRSYWWS